MTDQADAETVERVAKAIHLSQHGHTQPWDEMDEDSIYDEASARKIWDDIARAAISALAPQPITVEQAAQVFCDELRRIRFARLDKKQSKDHLIMRLDYDALRALTTPKGENQ